MTFSELQQQRSLLLLECVSGSHAYGLSLPTSDTDLKGVFVLPRSSFYGLEYTEQVSNESNDEVYYELKRFIDLLSKNNPNILELLNTPADSVRHRHPLMELIKPELFLSKLCEQTFAGYAQTQIRKARGLNKKILRPFEKERKSILDFCYVAQGQGTVPVQEWLYARHWMQEHCGLTALPHFRDGYALFYDANEPGMRGIASGHTAQDVSLSSIPKGLEPVAVMHFNKDGYSVYCREYKEYWDWVGKRNEERYENTLSHGKNYDAKNMMHTFRLLHMALEIATEGVVNVRRTDREFLLSIRRGEFEYDDLLKRADDKLLEIEAAYKTCSLPEAPDVQVAETILVEMRERFYAS